MRYRLTMARIHPVRWCLGRRGPGVNAAGVNGGQMASGQIQGRFAPRRSARFGPARLAEVGQKPSLDRDGQERINALPRPPNEP
jgi:hypothetical protein